MAITLVINLTTSEINYSQISGYTCDIFVLIVSSGVGRPVFNLDLLRWEDLLLIWATLSGGFLYKGHRRRMFLLFTRLSLLLLAGSSFTGIRAYFLRIPTNTEDQLRH